LKSNLPCVVRTGTRADISRIARWQVAMARETEAMTLDQAVVTRGVNHVIDHPEIGQYMVAEIDLCPVACCLVLSEWSDWRNGSVLWIHSVYVEPAHRRSKIFQQMYSTLRERVAADPGLYGLRLYVDKSNTKAIRAYEALGMHGEHYQLYEWMK
jgi:ribosomal protein S18 acetylase RimI-like enzyme